MSTQWKIDIILNLCFTYYTRIIILSFKVKLMAKYFLKNMSKQVFIANFQFSKIFVEA